MVDTPTMKLSDKAIAMATSKRIAEMDGYIRELVAHMEKLEKRIAVLEKGAK